MVKMVIGSSIADRIDSLEIVDILDQVTSNWCSDVYTFLTVSQYSFFI
jgi:hypothetical protein